MCKARRRAATQLIERIHGIGRRWYAGIKATGEGKAQRIVEWLREHQADIGVPLGRHGTRGLYRRPQAQCLLKADNDYQAILAWLRSKHGLTPHQKANLKARRRHRDAMGDQHVEQGLDWLQALSITQGAYRKEAERFLLWAIVRKGKALSSMTNEDCTEYREFFGNPQPLGRWCGDRSRARWSPPWRPFEGPLSASAQRHAITIVKNLYGFRVDQNYLMGNPWSAVGVPRSAGPKVNAGRSLTLAQWAFVRQQLELLPSTSICSGSSLEPMAWTISRCRAGCSPWLARGRRSGKCRYRSTWWQRGLTEQLAGGPTG